MAGELSGYLVRKPVLAARLHGQRRSQLARLASDRSERAAAQIKDALYYFARYELAFRETHRCSECGLELTDPVSIARTLGPDCLADLQERAAEEDRIRTLTYVRHSVEEPDTF